MKETERVDCTGRPIRLTDEQRSRKGRRRCPGWTAPDDMPDHIVLDTLAGVVCGAVIRGAKGDDRFCRTAPADVDRSKPSPYRCRSHGGIPENKARPGNTNALKYGLYTEALHEDERELWAKTTAESVDEEIVMAKVRLRRALIAESKAEYAVEHYDEEIGKLGETDDGREVVLKIKTRFANMTKLVDQIVNQIARLYALKASRQGGRIEATSEGVVVYLPDNGRD